MKITDQHSFVKRVFSFQNQITLMLFFAIIMPVVFLALFLLPKLFDESTRQAVTWQEALNVTIKNAFKYQITEWAKKLLRFSQIPSVQSIKRENLDIEINKFFADNPAFFNIFVYDSSGKVVTIVFRNHDQSDNNLIGQNISSFTEPVKNAFSSVLKKNTFQICEKIVEYRDQTRFIILVPINEFDNPNKVTGVLSCSIHLEGVFFQEMINSFFDSKNSALVLTDFSGKLIAQGGARIPVDISRIDRIQQENRLDGKIAESDWIDVSGQTFLVSAHSIDDLKCNLFLFTPKEKVLSFGTFLFWSFAASTVISLFLAAVFAWFFAEKSVKPLLNLMDGIKKISNGIYHSRIEIRGDDELAETCNAFNQMAEDLEKNRLFEELWNQSWNNPK
ncbi:MAG: HAMP domain-containing protein [Candidatus Riflebacteria bacterium]|nr:HAMP domain-containing protein [Candidatus Riflebacteria bacterium]